MFKTKEEIIEILNQKEGDEKAVAEKMLSVLSQNSKDKITLGVFELTPWVSEFIKELPPSKMLQDMKSISEKTSWENAVKREATAKIIEYHCLLADILWDFRDDSRCAQFISAAYKCCTESKDAMLKSKIDKLVPLAHENLGLLYSDEKSACYNLDEAFVYLKLLFGVYGGSENPEVIFCYAKALQNNRVFYNDAFNMFARAASKGHEQAKIEYQKICRARNLCTNCGGSFKGFIFKKCTRCGEKKSY